MKYRFRVRDLIIFLAASQILFHLLLHWNTYSCHSQANIKMLLFIVMLLSRQLCSHFVKKIPYLFSTIGLFIATLSLTYVAATQECDQNATFIVSSVIGLLMCLRTLYQFANKQNPTIAKVQSIDL